MSLSDSTRQDDPGALDVPHTSWRSFARHKLVSHVDQRIAAVSHLSIAFGIFIGVGFLLGIAINLVIWLRSRSSPLVEYHAEQAGAYQLTVLLTNALLVGTWIGVTFMLMGDSQLGQGELSMRQILMGLWCALVPLGVGWFFGTILYGVYGGLLVAAGRDFAYPIFGRWARRRAEKRLGQKKG